MIGAVESAVYEFDDFRFVAKRRLLNRKSSGEDVHLSPKAAELLLFFLKNDGRLLSKDELFEEVWGDSFVEESNLSQTVFLLRKALGEPHKEPQFILTVPNRGYKFIASVNEILAEDNILDVDVLTEKETDRVSSSELQVPSSMAKSFWLAVPIVLLISLIIGIAFWTRSEPNSPPASVNSVKAIAVLPFKNIESRQDDGLLGIGMADAVITKLSRLKSIVVRQTQSVMRYADTTPEAIKVGREINVDAVLEGNIQKADGRIRLSARLFRVSDGALLWAENFDERDTDIFALQDSISEKVANSLSLQLNADERTKLKRRYTENIEAYNLYQKGRYFWNNRTANDLRKSIELFEQAIALDGNYALPHAGLAETYVLLQFFSQTQKNDFFPKAKQAAEKSLSLDNDLAEPHAALALHKQLYEWDWAGAETEFKLAIAINPNYATAHQWYGEFLSAMGRFDESIAELEKAVELDPLSISTNTALAQPYLASGRYAEAIEKLKPALELDPYYSLALLHLGRAHDGLGNYKEAIAQTKKAGGSPYFITQWIYSYAKDGQKKKAEEELNGLLELDKKTPVSNYVLARGFAALGYKERALEKLEIAFEERDGFMALLKTDRNLDDLSSEARFQKILSDMKLNN